MKILYYITSHGYGHASRTAAICNHIPLDIDLVIRTTVPKSFFDQELCRPFEYAPAEFDCGCIQTDGVTVNVDATMDAYIDADRRNESLLDDEAVWCKSRGVSIIVSDIVPFAFEVAGRTGIRSVAATNFTWHTIYEEYAKQRPDFSPFLDKMRDQYASANLLLEMYPANKMPYFTRRVKVGPVGRAGANIHQRIVEECRISGEKKIGLIYTGNFGMDDVHWKDLERYGDWEFFGLYPLPVSPANFHLIDKNKFRYVDCVASADVMVSKLGYGTCAECLINGLPFAYLPRERFAEFPVLHEAMTNWGHGYLISKQDFNKLNWESALLFAKEHEKPAPFPSDAAEACAREIIKLCRSV